MMAGSPNALLLRKQTMRPGIYAPFQDTIGLIGRITPGAPGRDREGGRRDPDLLAGGDRREGEARLAQVSRASDRRAGPVRRARPGDLRAGRSLATMRRQLTDSMSVLPTNAPDTIFASQWSAVPVR